MSTLIATAALIVVDAASDDAFDIVLFGGMVIDGTGAPAYAADVGIRGDKIAEIGDLSDSEADTFVDARGLTVVPGFIDIHSHADGPSAAGGLRSFNPRRRAAPNQIAQGVTTVVVNQDGRSPLRIDRQRAELTRRHIGPNTILMVGHNTIRRAVMEKDHERPATDEEIRAMAGLLRRGMEDGAFGLTAGLEYVPGIWSTADELTALVREIVPYHGTYIVHERSSGLDPMWFVPSRDASEQPTMMDSIEETVRIARETGATTVATHIKARGTGYWGKAERIVEFIEKAREEGVRIYADQYPYRSSGSDGSVTLLPYWILGEFKGKSTDYQGALGAALSDPASSQALIRDIRHEIDRRGGAENIVIVDHPDRRLVGRSLAAIATDNETTPIAMVQLLQVQGYPKLFGGARFRGYSMSQTDVNVFAAQSWVATASDSGIALPNEQLVHPRHYGTFPRKLRRYALDRELMALPMAIRSMTSLPAEIMNISDRGTIRTGNYADIAVLDLDELRDTSTYFNPHRYPDGIVHVFVNGVPVVENAILSWTLPGLVLRPSPVVKADPPKLRQAD